MAGFDPNTNVIIATIGINEIVYTSPNAAANEATLLACPDGANWQLELLSVNYRAHVAPVDASNNVNVDIEFVDDSNSDTVTDLRGSGATGKDIEYATTFALDDDGTVLINTQVWRGSQILDPGDVINAEFDVATPDTAAQGAALVVEYRVLRHS